MMRRGGLGVIFYGVKRAALLFFEGRFGRELEIQPPGPVALSTTAFGEDVGAACEAYSINNFRTLVHKVIYVLIAY